jgi:hypothetical protein
MRDREDKMIRPDPPGDDRNIDLSEIRKGLQSYDVPDPVVVSADTPVVSAQPVEPAAPPQMSAGTSDE